MLIASSRAEWWNAQWRYRIPIAVAGNGAERVDRTVVGKVDFGKALGALEASGSFDPASVRVVEVNESGRVVDDAVAFQFDRFVDFKPSGSDSKGEIVIYMKGTLAANGSRTFHVYFDVKAKGIGTVDIAPLVELKNEKVVYPSGIEDRHGRRSGHHVKTVTADYYWHAKGAAWAGIIDKNGNDWVNWKPSGGYGGNYRGLPNGTFHPGDDKQVTIESITEGPVRLRVAIKKKGTDPFVYDYYPTYARVTRLGGSHTNWWYEGTPGGVCDAGDAFVTSNGTEKKFPYTQHHRETLKDHWAFYKDGPTRMSMFLESHPGEVNSSFERTSTGESTMHVCRFNLPESPNPMSFTVGLVASKDNDVVKKHVESVFTDPTITVGSAERPGSVVVRAQGGRHSAGVRVRTIRGGKSLVISGLATCAGCTGVVALLSLDGKRVVARRTVVADNDGELRCNLGPHLATGHHVLRAETGGRAVVSSVVSVP
jgi:hypothetical protein